MLDAITALLKTSTKEDMFQLNYHDMEGLAGLLREYETLKEKYRLLKSTNCVI